jgi:hypothetical protein
MGIIKGSHTCLRSYTFVFLLQETEEGLTFDDLFQHNETIMKSQGNFEGFSHVIHGVK